MRALCLPPPVTLSSSTSRRAFVVVVQLSLVRLVTSWTVAHQAPLSRGILQARTLEWVAYPFSRGTSQPRDRTQVSALQVDSLPSEPPGKPKNTGVGSLFLLQWIFLPQESNRGLLHCRRILYQLSYPGRPQTLQINIRTLALTLTDKSSHWTALSRGVMLFDLHLNTISLTDKS